LKYGVLAAMAMALVHVIVAIITKRPAEEHIIQKLSVLYPDANIQYAQVEYIPATVVSVKHVTDALVMSMDSTSADFVPVAE
jgi:hypothetical protein